jgi:hypothetical protein
VRLEELGQWKKYSDLIWNRNRDLTVCSIVRYRVPPLVLLSSNICHQIRLEGRVTGGQSVIMYERANST